MGRAQLGGVSAHPPSPPLPARPSTRNRKETAPLTPEIPASLGIDRRGGLDAAERADAQADGGERDRKPARRVAGLPAAPAHGLRGGLPRGRVAVLARGAAAGPEGHVAAMQPLPPGDLFRIGTEGDGRARAPYPLEFERQFPLIAGLPAEAAAPELPTLEPRPDGKAPRRTAVHRPARCRPCPRPRWRLPRSRTCARRPGPTTSGPASRTRSIRCRRPARRARGGAGAL